MSKHILVTGGAGFIGSNFIRHLLENTPYQVTNVDNLTYAANKGILAEFDQQNNYRFIKADISNKGELRKVFDLTYEGIINFAAESHVDRSIQDAAPFLTSNIIGTANLLDALRQKRAKKMIQISTDEVYGSLDDNADAFTETNPLLPNNPYAATKASADLLVRSYFQTYGLPVLITRCSNNYGPYQHHEKLIPKAIKNAMLNQPIPIYGDGLNIRNWIFVKDHCRAILKVFEEGKYGEIYNIGSSEERTNKEVVELILDVLQQSPNLIQNIHDREGHDRRYAIDWGKMNKELGWEPHVSFENGLLLTVDWYKKKFGDSL